MCFDSNSLFTVSLRINFFGSKSSFKLHHLTAFKLFPSIHQWKTLLISFTELLCNTLEPYLVKSWRYNIRRNVNSDVSIVTMRRVAIKFFELGVVKNSMQKF